MIEKEFRGYSAIKGWVYGFLTIDRNSARMEGFPHFISRGHGYVPVEVAPASVGQFTGIEDNDGRKIYEKDALKVWCGGDEQTDPYTVEDMRDLYLQMNRDDRYYVFGGVLIVGNVYENPELLIYTQEEEDYD